MTGSRLILPPAAWRARAELSTLLAALGPGNARYVGGAVRDTLLGLDVSDIDIATRLTPDAAMSALRAAGIKMVPTGIAHGTVTAVLPGGPVEVTTLRRDVSTDGRHATVAFSEDWREDAARRDFTINALYADPESGEIFDYFGGLADLEARRIRFIGDALTRIAEDHLRILRFFRFHARFGRASPDAGGMAACVARARDLMALSRERIADELLKLLALPDPAPTIALMIEGGIFGAVLPEIDAAGLARLRRLIVLEGAVSAPADPIRRLAALLSADPGVADAAAARLRLSKADRRRMAAALAPAPVHVEEALYRLGHAGALDRLLLSGGEAATVSPLWAEIANRERPRLPIGGGALVQRGLDAGPLVAEGLQAVERRWIDEGFPDAARVDALADEIVAQLLRARR